MTQYDKGGGGGLGKEDGWQWQERGRQQENYVNWKIEPGPNFFKVLECGGGEEL